jgi:hypothetical protein
MEEEQNRVISLSTEVGLAEERMLVLCAINNFTNA